MSDTILDPERVRRAAVALAEGHARVTPGEEPGAYRVASFTGDGEYLVTTAPPGCTCPDSRIRGTLCKHRAAVALHLGLGDGD